MTNKILIDDSQIDAQIQQAEVEFSQALSFYQKLYIPADTIQAELRALKAFLKDPSDDMTVAELKIIEQRKSVLEMQLNTQWRTMEAARHRIVEAEKMVKELREANEYAGSRT
jgi:SpoVK/Ycf46/Vps4 family AAA+-type ATPase